MPSKGRYKVYLIDEVHMFSNHSFNALLKTLEEPPPHVKFLLATTDPQKLPVTIRSRCLQFNLKRIPQQMIESYLDELMSRESVEREPQAIAPIARAAEGSMRDALSLLDQAIAFGGGTLRAEEVATMLGTIEQRQLIEIVQALIQKDGVALLQQVELLAEKAVDFSAVLVELIAQLHQMALIQMVPGIAEERGIDAEWSVLSEQLSPEDLQLFYQIALTGRKDLPMAATLRSGLEMVLLRMLAFQPVTGQAAAVAPVAQRQPKQQPPQRTAAPPTAVTPQAVAAAAPTSASMPTSASISNSSADGGSDSWEQMIPALGLGGLAKQVAQNCLLKQREGLKVVLEIAEKSGSLLNARSEKQIRDALSSHLGGEVNLTFVVANSAQLDTPAARAEQRADDARSEAVNVIQQDADFQSLVSTFDGSVVEGSIEPVTKPN